MNNLPEPRLLRPSSGEMKDLSPSNAYECLEKLETGLSKEEVYLEHQPQETLLVPPKKTPNPVLIIKKEASPVNQPKQSPVLEAGGCNEGKLLMKVTLPSISF